MVALINTCFKYRTEIGNDKIKKMTDDFFEFEEKKSLNRKFRFEKRERENYYLVNINDSTDAYFYIGGRKYITEGKVYREDQMFISRDMAWLNAKYLKRINHKYESR